MYFLKDLLSGAKKRIKSTEVQHISLPAYEGLGVNDICDFLQSHQHVARYLPDLSEIRRLPKEFLANVSYTAIGKPFGDWVRQQIETRNQKLAIDRQLNIELDPELAQAFHASTAISSKFSPSCIFKSIYLDLLVSQLQRKKESGQICSN